MAIHLLDTHVAELIAAGEVVERPASVVKELVENSIDAGAGSVSVEIERGGISLIRITDDGSGIDSSDVELAFLRHATSKVRVQEDLESIETLGFRGEALASIASVARVELFTKNDADEFATRYTISGGNAEDMAEDARPRGTTFTVRDLFYNTPARMKFLKKDSSEAAYVTETVMRMALSHPEVAFRYIREGKQVFATPGDGDLKGAAYSVLGADFARDLVSVGYLDLQSRVIGYVTPPRAARASRGMQFFFINGRFVKNRTMMAALEQAYRGMIMQGKYPGCVLFLQMPPQLLDVNVHPAKTEVRFAQEQDVFGIVYRGVKSALVENEAEHSRLSFSAEPDKNTAEPKAAEREEAKPPVREAVVSDFGTKPVGGAPSASIGVYNTMVEDTAAQSEALQSGPAVGYERSNPIVPPVAPVFGGATQAGPRALDIDWEESDAGSAPKSQPVELFAEAEVERDEESVAEQQALDLPGEELFRVVGEVFKTYIIVEMGEGMCLIDKHAAHERILYEQIAAARGEVPAQQLLTPTNIALSAAEKNALLQNTEALNQVGIEVDDFGGNSILVRGVPADIDVGDVEDLVLDIAQRLSLNSRDGLNEKTEWVMHSVACRAAVKAGDKTSEMEMLALAKDIMDGTVPPFCPHGRPVVLEMTRKELEKQFGRLG